jgi:calcineurin-like phosphoesterase family protein
MGNIFFIADTHFSHKRIIEFTNEDGSKLRPFESIEEMDEHMVEAWNKTVHPKDKVYHLGDVVMNRSALPIVGRLNGRKILARGNHDNFKTTEYQEYFDEQFGYDCFDGFIICHIPVNEHEFPRFRGNIHGHLHSVSLPDPRYYCVSVEQTEYKPKPYELIKAEFLARQ